jgi:hypothetical protein
MFRWHWVLVSGSLLLSVFTAPVLAYPIRVNFTVSGDPNDPDLGGTTSTGYFTFDSSIVPYGGGMIWSNYPPGLEISSISFNWGGHRWTTDDAFSAILNFAGDGSLVGFNVQAKLTPGYTGNGNYPDFAIDVSASSQTFSYELTADRGYAGGVTTWDAARLPIIVGAWLFSGTQLALDSFGRVYSYDAPDGGVLGTVTMRGNLFNGAPVSPVKEMALGAGNSVFATLENGDLWLLPGNAQTGEYLGNIFSAPGIAAVTANVPRATNSMALPRPNPFNPDTQIPYTLAAPGRVTIRVFDASGRLVRTVEDVRRPAGSFAAMWDGRTDAGTAAASGTYFGRITFPDGETSERKLTILR